MDGTVEIDRDGKITVTIGDETGYSPDLCDDLCRRARETAIETHRAFHAVDV